MATKTKHKSITINKFELVFGRCYKVVHRKDSTAPSGMVDIGATKLPSEGIGNSVGARYVKKGKTGSYDTGFYKGSPCYTNKKSAGPLVDIAVDMIMEPYEDKYGANKLDNTNYDFWDPFSVDLYDGRVFNTEDVDDLLELYIVMLAYELCPVESIGNPIYRKAQYCVVDTDKAVDNENKRVLDVMQAAGDFQNLYTKDSVGAKDILRYLDVLTIMSDMEEGALKGLFFKWLQDDREHVTKFQRVQELYKNKKTKDIPALYSKMAKLMGKSDVLKRDGGQYYYEGNLLGGDLKTAATNVATSSELKDIKTAIFEA